MLAGKNGGPTMGFQVRKVCLNYDENAAFLH